MRQHYKKPGLPARKIRGRVLSSSSQRTSPRLCWQRLPEAVDLRATALRTRLGSPDQESRPGLGPPCRSAVSLPSQVYQRPLPGALQA
jgi:hypothetical protein